jgi:P27 family predicted phage terminase small subunit
VELQQVVGIALRRAGFPLDEAEREQVGTVDAFSIDPQHPAFARDPAWQDAFDGLRARRRGRRERPNEWRRRVPPRAIAFEPPVEPDGRDADHVVQVHLEDRLVRRLLGRFLSQGFQSGLDRAMLAAYCQAHALWVEAVSSIGRYGTMVKSPNGYPMQSPYVAVANKQVEIMVRIASELGMTPSSRTRIRVGAKTPEDPFEAFLQGRG